MDSEPLKVGLLGCGTVGSAVARIILSQGDELAARIGRRLELAAVSVRDLSRPRPELPAEILTDDPMDMVRNQKLDIVIELIGGIEPARELILAAIANGSSVVTANKALLATHGKEIITAASKAGVDVYYEAAVAGAIPIIRPLRESLVGDSINVVMGIVNGTTNYILDKMSTEGMDYQTALRQAQELGYAEADPTADVEGHDAAAKAALLASLAFHTWVPGDQVHCEGISQLTKQDIKAAEDLGCVVKLLAVASQGPAGVLVRVHPTLLPKSHPLATVGGAYNAIFVEAKAAGRLMFLGPGAGGAPTASAVVGDLVTVARHRARGVVGTTQSMYADRPLASIDQLSSRYFLRLEVRDEPGVLANVASILARHQISVEKAQQTPAFTPSEASAELYLMTHAAHEAEMKACVAELKEVNQVLGNVRYLRVEGM